MFEAIPEQDLKASSNLPIVDIELRGKYNTQINQENYNNALCRLQKIITGEEIFSYPTVNIFGGDNPDALTEVNLPILNEEEVILFFRAIRYYEYLLENKKEPEVIERNTPTPEWEEDENQYFKILLYNYCNTNKDIPIEDICKNNGREIHEIIGNIKEIISSSNWKLVKSLILQRIMCRPGINSFKRDLQQEGQRIICEKAIPKFDVTKGYNFSTYATWWVNQAIGRFLEDHSRTIRIPTHLQAKFSKMSKILQKEHRDLRSEGLSQKDKNLLRQCGFSEMAVTSYDQHLRRKMKSLDDAKKDDSDDDLYDETDNNSPLLEELIEQRERREEAIRRLLYADISKRTVVVFYLRFGFLEDKEVTLEEAGDIIGITRERVRQIKEKFTQRLRYITRDTPIHFQNEESLREYIIYNFWIPSQIRKNISGESYKFLNSLYGFKDTDHKDIKTISEQNDIPVSEVIKQINTAQERMKEFILPISIDSDQHNYLEYLELYKDQISSQ
jgi:RNA polymerase primary sigma factor